MQERDISVWYVKVEEPRELTLISGVWEEAQQSCHRGDHEGVEICGHWERVTDGQALHHE